MSLSLPDPPINADESRSSAQEIVDSIGADEDRRSIISRIIDWVVERWQKMMDSTVGNSSPTTRVLGWILVALILVALGFAVWKLRRSLSNERVFDTPLSSQVGRPSNDWILDAINARSRGDLRESARCWTRAIIASLHASGGVFEEAGKTIGDYRKDAYTTLSESDFEEFRTCTEIFNNVWYGDRTPSEVELQQLEMLARRSVVPVRARGEVVIGDLETV